MEFPSTIQKCHDEIQRLLEENAALRQSGASFGRLAERLSAALREQQRLAREGRILGRPAEDRQPEPAMSGADRHSLPRSPRS